jgi:hypothetical protein
MKEKMQIVTNLLVLALWCIGAAQALITLESIRNLTRVTDELKGRIEDLGRVQQVDVDPVVRALGGVDVNQVRLGGEDGDEVEAVSAFRFGLCLLVFCFAVCY